MAKEQRPGVIFQPKAYRHLQTGVNQILNVIRPTLGPYPRIVAYDSDTSSRGPELLDEGGTIARRIIQIADRHADMGAMYIRQMLWQLHQKVGDGTATAAVLFQIVYNEGLRYLAAGGSAMPLRRHLEKGMALILVQLDQMTIQVKGKQQLAQVARTVCYEPELAQMLGEIFDIIGEYGRLEMRSGRGRGLEREYVEGMYWKGGLLSRQLVTDHARVRTDLENAAILITDLEVKEPQDLLSPVTLAVRNKINSLALVCKSVSDICVGLLNHEKTLDKIRVLPVKTPGFALSDQAMSLQDLAILTGGRPIISKAGETLRDVRFEDFGYARRIWGDKNNFGLSGGRGDTRKLREHIATLRSGYNRTSNADDRKQFQERISKLLGGSATLWIGGSTESEIKARRNLAERTAQALRGAVLEGVIPGGGIALLACRPVLQERLDQAADADERAAYRILLRAVEEPIRTLVSNAGYEASEVMAKIGYAGNGCGFDLDTGQVVSMREAGIYDIATVQKEAVHSAISSAALALTIDVLVHHRKPDESLQP